VGGGGRKVGKISKHGERVDKNKASGKAQGSARGELRQNLYLKEKRPKEGKIERRPHKKEMAVKEKVGGRFFLHKQERKEASCQTKKKLRKIEKYFSGRERGSLGYSYRIGGKKRVQ